MKRFGMLLCLVAACSNPAPTAEECIAFARAHAEAVSSGDPAAAARTVDWDALLEKATEGPETGFRDGFVRGATRQARTKGGLFSEICASMGKGATYRFLRMAERDGLTCARFRYLPVGGGVNYFDLYLGRDANGEVAATDVYLYLAGERLSDSMRRLYLPAAAEADEGFADRLDADAGSILTALKGLKEMSELFRAGRREEALARFDALPETLRRDRFLLTLRLRITQGAMEEEYLRTMDTIRDLFPADPSVALLSVDAFVLRGRHAEALEALALVERVVGGDPYLDVLRANIRQRSGDLPAAAAAARRAVEAEPTLRAAHFAEVEAALAAKDHARVATKLTEIESRFGDDFTSLEKQEAYADFVASPEHAAWRARKQGD